MIKRIKERMKQRRGGAAIFIKELNEVIGPYQGHQSLKHFISFLFVGSFAERRFGLSGYVKRRTIDGLIWD
jgi:hypothetical protein